MQSAFEILAHVAVPAGGDPALGLTRKRHILRYICTISCMDRNAVTARNKADYIITGQRIAAAREFDKWAKAAGKTMNGLVRRRDAEEANFVKYCLPNGKFPTKGLEYGN